MFWDRSVTSQPIDSRTSPANSVSTYHSPLSENEELPEVPSLEPYALKAAKLIQLINQLRDVGAQVDLDLPSIVVCGNQRLASRKSKTTSWKCNVKIRNEFDRYGSPLDSVQEVQFCNVNSPNGLDLILKKAQLAILNPSTDPLSFLNSEIPTYDDENELMFSRNVICVDITGANVDLTLIDLPGIIHSVSSNQDMRMITMVESVVKHYISKPRSLILAVITCKDEIENQAIFHFSREVDATGCRTIGVLTKPDTIEEGTHDRWLQVLLGNQYSLNLGWFMVKLPSKIEIKDCQNVSDNQKLESKFFSNTFPWSNLRSRSDRFGISRLTIELNKLLAELIEGSLPEMKRATELALEKVVHKLDSLPPAVSGDGKIEILQTIRHFSTIVNYHINAQQNLKVFNQKIRRHYEVFRDAIISSKPKFICQSEKDSGTTSFWKKPDNSSPPRPSNNKSTINASPTRNNIKSTEFSLDDLRSIVNNQKGKELDGYSSYSAFEFMVKYSQQTWKSHATNLLVHVSKELQLLLNKLSEEVFGRFAVLKKQVKFLIQVFPSDLQRITHDHITHSVTMESRHPFTLNSAGFARLKTEVLEQLMTQLPPESTPVPNNATAYPVNRSDAIKKAVSALSDIGVRGITTQNLFSRLNISSTHSSESHLLDLMAGSIAFFEISSTRFIDQICQQIDFHFLGSFGDLLEKELLHSLSILDKDPTEILALLREDVGVSESRRIANEKRIRLEKMWRNLHELDL
ncbi:hypothetical protein HDV02_000037 [Globomyces sp. JEL0801]|nr:hypothetical protein HDV02_000037 [Globomyces sp. JEL0801]